MGILSPIEDQSPVADYDPTQSLHTPGGVLPPIMSGDGSIAKSPDIEGTADQLSKRGLLSHDLGKQIYSAEKPPEPAASPGTIDWYKQRGQQIEYQKEHPWGSPISAHPGVLGKIFHGLAAAGNIAGDVLAPGTMSLIPGTQLNRSLEESSNAAGLQRAETEHNQETEAAAAETKANAEQENADTAKAASGQPKAKEEEWDVVQGFEGPNGEPILKEKNSGQMKLAGPAGAKPIKATADKPDNPEQQFVDEYQKGHPGSSVADAQRAFKQNENLPPKPQQQLGLTPDMKVVEISPGMTLPQGTQLLGAGIKAEGADQGIQNQLALARELAASPSPTNDFSLLMAFVGVTKPESVGKIRFNQNELRTVVGTRSALGDVQALEQKLANGEMLTPEQRKNMVDTMEIVARHSGNASQGGTQRFTVDGRTYNIPADKVAEFKKDHPNAR